jgi:hypothetical protein
MDHWNLIAEFAFEERIEVPRAANANETVGIGQPSEDPDIIVTLELRTYSHDDTGQPRSDE